MNKKRATIFFVFAATLFFCIRPVLAQENTIEAIPREVLVRFEGQDGVVKISYEGNEQPEAVANTIAHIDGVDFVEPNYTLHVAAFPNDPLFSSQPYLMMLSIKEAWSKELLYREKKNNTTKPVIAVLDTGVDIDHPDLIQKIWSNKQEKIDQRDNDGNGYIDDMYGWDFVNNDATLKPEISGEYSRDASNHGTIVAGIAAAHTNNGEGVSGLSWHAEIMPLRVLDSDGSGDVYSVIKAIDYALAKNVDVINMSFVGTNYSKALFDKIKQASDAGIIVVAAAGNTNEQINGTDTTENNNYPVCYDGVNGENYVLGVASVGLDYRKSSFSNYGKCVDFVASGEKIFSTSLFESGKHDFSKLYDGYWEGTSLAAPQVSALAATVKSLRPDLNVNDIKSILELTARDVNSFNVLYKDKLGKGIIDPLAAITMATEYRSSRPPTTGSQQYLVAGLGMRSFPQIKILDAKGETFKSFFAYNPNFNGVIYVAAGDVTGDGVEEVVTAAGQGGGPHVRVFDVNGQLVSEFFAASATFRGGITVSVGDVTGDGSEEIVIGMGPGTQPEVKIFDFRGTLLASFLAYDAKYRGGVKVAVGDVDGDGDREMVTGPGAGGGPHVRIFDASGNVLSQFFAYNQDYRGGINIAVGDVNGDGLDEIVAAVEKNSLPTIRIFNYQGKMFRNFIPFEPNMTSGVHVATADIDGNGIAEIISSAAAGGPATIIATDSSGNKKESFIGQGGNYKGGVRAAEIKL